MQQQRNTVHPRWKAVENPSLEGQESNAERSKIPFPIRQSMQDKLEPRAVLPQPRAIVKIKPVVPDQSSIEYRPVDRGHRDERREREQILSDVAWHVRYLACDNVATGPASVMRKQLPPPATGTYSSVA